jgi:hypothetical protein
MRQRFMPQEDVKKSICLSFPDFIFDPKCLPTPQRSLTGHPRAICYTQISEQISKSIFSHLPDNQTPDNQTLMDVDWDQPCGDGSRGLKASFANKE